MFKIIGSLLLVLFLASCQQDQQAHLNVQFINTSHGQIVEEELMYLEQGLQESDDDFLLGVANYIQDFTDANNYEACGRFGVALKDMKRMSIRIASNHSHKGCIISNIVKDGYVSINVYIHSHPTITSASVNVSDQVLLRNSGIFVPLGTRFYGDPYRFSREDYSCGPGYLVVNRILLYQKGPGTQSIVTRF